MVGAGAEAPALERKTMADKTPTAEEIMGEPAPTNSILTTAEIKAAMAVAKSRTEKALKDAETERLIEQEMARLRREEGKRTGVADMDELVGVYIDLPEFCGSLRINGETYHHGYTYKVPRHMANSMREQMQRAYFHQAAVDGKGMEEAMRRAQPKKLSLATGAAGDYVEGEAA